MKFMCYVAFLFVLILYLTQVNCLKARSKLKLKSGLKMKSTMKSKLKTSTETSIMEFLGNLYSEASENKNRVESLDGELAPAATSTSATPKKVVRRVRRDSLVEDTANLNLIQEGFLSISSKEFVNERVYPRIILPNYDETYINTEETSSFRINKMFDPSKSKDGKSPPTDQSFYFRLSFRNLWYSYTKDNVEVLGAIPVKKIVTAQEKIFDKKKPQSFCFNVIDSVNARWELCAENSNDRKIWICKIKQLKKEVDPTCDLAKMEKFSNVPVTEFERKVNQAIILIPQANRFCNDNWNYEAKGTDWECDCKEGNEQSPINIPTSEVIESPVVPVFTYHEVKVHNTDTTDDGQIRTHSFVKIFNEDHQLKIKADSFGTVVTLNGATYNAESIVFHTPSEHQIDGRVFPMEMQIVHKGISEGVISDHVILSFLFTRTPGVYNKFLDDVDFFNLPNLMVKERKMETDLYIPKIFYTADEDDIPVMKPFSVYTYQGSLTAPPCTQRVIHYVAAEPIEVGSTAIDLFQEAIRMPDMRNSKGEVIVSTATNENNRVIQPLNGRNVYYYKVQKEEIAALKEHYTPPKPEGHYEKVVKKIKNYYYVNNNHPSGMPGSIVVSEQEAKGFAI